MQEVLFLLFDIRLLVVYDDTQKFSLEARFGNRKINYTYKTRAIRLYVDTTISRTQKENKLIIIIDYFFAHLNDPPRTLLDQILP